MNERPARFLPFLDWFPLRGETVRADLLAGIVAALRGASAQLAIGPGRWIVRCR